MKSKFNARQLRIVLFATMFLLTAGAIVGFYFAQKSLGEYARTISQLNADAQSGDQNLQTLRTLETTLKEEQPTIERVRGIVADNSNFANESIGEITRIARESGVKITGFELVESGSGSTTSGTPSTGTTVAPTTSTAPSTAPSAAGSTTAAPSSGSLPAGIVKKSVSISIESPVSYTALMSFLQKIETSPLQMQVATVSMTKDKGTAVATQSYSIEVYVRQ